MNIALLDDDLVILDLLEASLARSKPDWVVSRFFDPDFAIGELQKAPPEVLVLDAHMPNTDAAGVLKALGASAPPTIILSGDDILEVQYLKDFSCVRGILKKPFSPREIASQIEVLLHACTPL